MSGTEGGPNKRPCPQCGKPASGNFCQHCGASMGGRFCTQCGAELTPGSRFCNQCGKPVDAAAPAGPVAAPPQAPGAHRAAAAATLGGGNLPWWIAGVSMFVMILVVGYFSVRRSPSPAQNGGGASQANSPALGASSIDLSTMTPIQAADSLFDDVMRHLAAGDTAWAIRFQPMAVSAYQRAEPLDLGGLFDLSLLQRLTEPDSALATAKRILQKDPNHVLGLAAAAEAAVDLGDSATAATYYRHLLDVYAAQVGDTTTPGYLAHEPLLSLVKGEAQKYVAQYKK